MVTTQTNVIQATTPFSLVKEKDEHQSVKFIDKHLAWYCQLIIVTSIWDTTKLLTVILTDMLMS